MLEIKNKSYRAKLVKVVTKAFVKENLFEFMSNFQENLQNRLNSELKFETKVSNIESYKNNCQTGLITFENEWGTIMNIEFSIINTLASL